MVRNRRLYRVVGDQEIKPGIDITLYDNQTHYLILGDPNLIKSVIVNGLSFIS